MAHGTASAFVTAIENVLLLIQLKGVREEMEKDDFSK